MKLILIPFQILALIGFGLSVWVHISSLFGIVAFPGAESLHIGIFVVFLPAMLANMTMFRRVRMNQKELWKILLRGCPPWMAKFSMGMFAYTFVNFVYFMFLTSMHPLPKHTGGAMPAEVLRGFSGHWMFFYWVSFAILYSRTHITGPMIPSCANCKAEISPFDKFCAGCGHAINPPA